MSLWDGTLGRSLQVWLYGVLHSWTGLSVALYVVTAVFALAGLRRGGARWTAYLWWPVLTVPLTALVLLLFELLVRALPRWGMPLQSLISVTFLAEATAMVGGLLGGFAWARRGQALAGAHRRGTRVQETRPLPRASAERRVSTLQRAAASSPAARERVPITIAGVTMPASDEVMHTKITGTTGTGKSTVIREMVHAARTRGDRLVIADPSGAYLSRFYDPKQGDVILNPFDTRSARWDLFRELHAPYDIDEIARALIPDKSGDQAQWVSYARTFFSCVASQLQRTGEPNLVELYRLLTSAPKDELKMILQGTPAARFLEEGSERQFAGTLSNTVDNVKCLEYLRAQTGPAFSLSQWVKSGRGIVFLPYRADQIAAIQSLISMWLRIAISKTLSLPEGDARIWFIIDELDAVGTIHGLSDALTRLRDRGGRCVLGFQSIAQVSVRYGLGIAQAIVENCGNTLLLRCSASERGGTSQFASSLIGMREVVRLAASRSESTRGLPGSDQRTQGQSEQTTLEPAVLASEIEQLPDRTGYLKFASTPTWRKVGFPYYPLEKTVV